jgi:predicted phage terminase large subunit-like protein
MQNVIKELQQVIGHDIVATKQIQSLLKQHYSKNFYHFFKDFYPHVKGTPFKLHSTVQYVCENLNLFADYEIKDLVISVYRGWGKSVLCSEFLPAWLLLRDSGERIGCYSRAMTNDAKLWHKNTYEILNQPLVKFIFEGIDFKLNKVNETIITTTKHGYRRLGSCLASSVGSDLTTAIVDDPQDQEHYRSEAKRQRFFNFLTNSLNRAVRTTRFIEDETYFNQLSASQKKEWEFEKSFNSSDVMQRQPRMLLIMQRLFDGDAVGLKLKMHEEMVKNGIEHKFAYIAIPAIMQEDNIFIMPISKEVVKYKQGDYVVAGTATKAEIDKAKFEMSPEDFSAQMLMKPLQNGSVFFKKEYINYVENIEGIAFNEICVSFDTAYKDGSYNDPTACVVFGIYKNKVYVLESHVKKLEFPELVKFTQDIINKYSRDYGKRVSVLIEDKGSGQSLIQDLKRNNVFGIIPCQPKGGKEDRLQRAITSIKTTLESGGFNVPTHAKWLPDYINELFNFPNALHDDQVDATAQFFNWWSERKKAHTIFDFYTNSNINHTIQ